MEKVTKIVVVGLGYIGLPTAAVFASRKIKVIGVDVNQTIVDTINRGDIHIKEPDLDIIVRSVVAQNYLTARTAPVSADAFLIAVPTPFEDEDHKPDLKYIKAAAKSIAPFLKKGDLVVLESTSPVGTTEQLADWLSGERQDLSFPQVSGEGSDIRVAYCPERVLPGHILRELVQNDRVIGGMTTACSKAAVALYKTFVTGACITTNARTAEMTKLTENSFRDVNIAFANEISTICDALKINVWDLIALSNRHPRVNILNPGPGVGGHCIAVDPWFIVSKTPEITKIIRAAREVNDAKPEWVVEKIKATIGEFLLKNPEKTAAEVTVACYGLTFKPDVDDIRESPAMEVVTRFSDGFAGKTIAVDPNLPKLPSLKNVKMVEFESAKQIGDIHVLLVAHREFSDDQPAGTILDVTGAWN